MKTMGVVALVVLATMALAGAGSASAVTLCKVKLGKEEKACPKEKNYPLKTEIGGKLEKGKVSKITDGSKFGVECAIAEWSGSTTAESSEVLEGATKSFELSSCASLFGESNCFTVMLNQPWSLAIRASGLNDGNGKYTYSNGGSGVPGIRMTCGTEHCRYGAAQITGTVIGGTPAILTINQMLSLQTDSPENSPLCGPNTTWTTAFILSPSPLFIY
ncbi:MAG TPA: hypothetical protein VGC63_12865 [Solirubrobacterales bacterium]|jgi:hypothetical protein